MHTAPLIALPSLLWVWETNNRYTMPANQSTKYVFWSQHSHLLWSPEPPGPARRQQNPSPFTSNMQKDCTHVYANIPLYHSWGTDSTILFPLLHWKISIERTHLHTHQGLLQKLNYCFPLSFHAVLPALVLLLVFEVKMKCHTHTNTSNLSQTFQCWASSSSSSHSVTMASW